MIRKRLGFFLIALLPAWFEATLIIALYYNFFPMRVWLYLGITLIGMFLLFIGLEFYNRGDM